MCLNQDVGLLIQTILQPFEFELLLPSTCFHITEKLEKKSLFFTQSRKTLDDSSNQLNYICEKSVGSPESEQCINFVIRIIASSADIWIDAELLVTCHCLQDNVLSDRAKRCVTNQSYDHLHHNPPSLCEYLILRMINDRTNKKKQGVEYSWTVATQGIFDNVVLRQQWTISRSSQQNRLIGLLREPV